MKAIYHQTTHPLTVSIPRRPTGSAKGAALILTLGMLVLLSGVVLAFLLTVRTEYGAAKGYEGGTNARLLADSALNVVIGQIREASTQPTQLAPAYFYDSRGYLRPGKSADSLAPLTRNQLPPMIQVTMVVIDERSAERFQSLPGAAPAALFDRCLHWSRQQKKHGALPPLFAAADRASSQWSAILLDGRISPVKNF